METTGSQRHRPRTPQRRPRQKNKMTVVHLQGSEVERKMYAMLQGKVDRHKNLVDLYREEIGL